jgi:hypothetical protein
LPFPEEQIFPAGDVPQSSEMGPIEELAYPVSCVALTVIFAYVLKLIHPTMSFHPHDVDAGDTVFVRFVDAMADAGEKNSARKNPPAASEAKKRFFFMALCIML